MGILDSKFAIVTGASRGIGRVIALELAKAGATVCVNFHQSEDKAKGVLSELQKISQKNHMMSQFDVSLWEETEKAMTACIETWGQCDILVNNAGVTRDNLVLRMKESEWDEVIDQNLKGTFHCSKVAAKYMLKKREGRVINITSYAGVAGNAGQTNYAASKAGMVGFTKSMAKELASRHITVNAIAPGFIQTEMTGQLPQDKQKDIAANIPLGFFGTCEDVAHLVIFLASPHARYITGQVIGVNGGLYI